MQSATTDALGWGLMVTGFFTAGLAPAVWSTPAWQWAMVGAGLVMVVCSVAI